MSHASIHPFFQQSQKKQQQQPSKDPIPSPKVDLAPARVDRPPRVTWRPQRATAKKDSYKFDHEEPKAKSTRSTKKTAPVIKKRTLIESEPQTASCSQPHHVPIQKPKFYSDTIEYKRRMEHEDKYDLYGLLPEFRKLKYDTEFSRLGQRHIFGHGHIGMTKVDGSDVDMKCRKPFSMTDLIKSKEKEFFQLGKKKREEEQRKRMRRKDYTKKINNQTDLDDYLNSTFPLWNSYTSCVILYQYVIHQKNSDKNKAWIDKYRPKSVNGLMGERHNFVYLQDWLHQMKIEPMSAPRPDDESGAKRIKKKKKKKVIELDDELNGLSIMDDDDDDDFMPTKKKKEAKSTMRSNMILLSGDNGVGKTASVYTIAHQLGYEVFEINSGMKRSGKDIMAMVGDMAKNHHVVFDMNQRKPVVTDQEDSVKKSKKLKLNPYLSSSASKSTAGGGEGLFKHFLRDPKSMKGNKPAVKSTASEPKQSLILLEEVDVLFDQDKAFWNSVIELSQNSKRPIVMTCNDLDQVPFENLCLQNGLEYKPPPETEMLPYLWLICFAEGYMIDPADLICLMAFLGRDIRQLIQTLEMYCKNQNSIFENYLSLYHHDELKLRCIPSRAAVDTFRLAQCYLNQDEVDVEMDSTEADLFQIEKAMENNAFIDAYLTWKHEGLLIDKDTKDQIAGFTIISMEEDHELTESRLILQQVESTCIQLTYEPFVSDKIWYNTLSEESSHWDELCDAKSSFFEEYFDAIERALPVNMAQTPNEGVLMMEYVPYIQQMIAANTKTTKTRSKRKRFHLPLKESNIHSLSLTTPHIMDETQFWVNRLQKL